MKCINRLLIAIGFVLTALSIQAQTQVTAPMTGTPAAGSYFSYSSITLSPGFSFTAAPGSSLSLYIANPDCQKLLNSFNQNQNYIVTSTPRVGGMRTVGSTPNAGDFANRTTCELMQTVQYFDGLGRPLQTVQVQGSPSNKDVVQPFAYDQFGREVTKYLPYVTAGSNDGSYKADALTTGINSFYNPTGSGTSGTQQSNGIVVIPQPFAQSILEPSPLNRVVEQGAPGADWQPVANSTSGHTQKIRYTTNNDTVLTDTAHTMLASLYTATVNANQSRTLARNGNYGAGQLYVTVSKDENWKSGRGGTTEEYKDKEGHVVLKRTFNYKGTTLQLLSTYYVYDDLGNLAFVLPPGTNADNALPSGTVISSLGYSYRYDERNRLTQKKIPGKGWEFTVYNKLDQPVLSQDSLQRQSNQWAVTKYDALGRVIMTGLWNAGTVYALSTLQSNIYAVTQWDTRDQTGNMGSYPSGYVLGSYPIITKTLSINYYDDYNNIPNLPTGYKVSSGVSTMTKGLLTASKTAVLNTITNPTPAMLLDVNYYDDEGQNIRSYKQHYLSGAVDTANFDVVLSKYNFNDQLTNVNRRHFTRATLGTPRLTIINDYSYDHMGRKLTTREQLQNGLSGGLQPADVRPILSKAEYNELGQLWKKNLHSTDSITFKQTITYNYNERGWLNTSSAPLFAEQLYYNTGTSKQYNGNIAYQYWGTAGSLTKNYAYGYDQLNRLTGATASTGNHENNITYDMMGNITALNRYSASTQIDQLSYTYAAGTNTLQSVTDGTTNDQGQIHGTATYAYDGNGNLTADNSKGITGISYNLLNLPQVITGKSTTYTYDATGQKLSRLIGTAETDYIGGIQYDGTAASSTISFIQTEEGRALPKDATSYNYEYSLTDHLGNSRVNFDTGTGTARQVQVDDYYAFGMEVSTSVASPKNEYLYNKKELQENLGLYDYGARFYDPVIARWTSVDPLVEAGQESTSPYGYVYDDPIKNTDPDGRYPDGPDDDPPGVLSMAGNFVKGIGQSVAGTVTGTVNMVLHPIETVKSIASLNTTEGQVNMAIAGGMAIEKFKKGNGNVKSNMLGNLTGDVAQLFIGTEEIKLATDALKITKAVDEVGQVAKVTNTIEKADGSAAKLSKVEKSKTTESIGGKYTKTTEVRPGKGPGQSRAEITRVKNSEGKTIRTYKDSYDRANKFQHRKPLRGGPEGRPQ
jgi:RHS repeat-associated protein